MDDISADGLNKCCCTCKQWKPLTEFNRLARSKDGRQPRCRQCHAEYHQEHKHRINPMIHARNRRMDIAMRERLYDYLAEHGCVDCGETDILVLEFDHVWGKTMNVARLVGNRTTWTRMLQEIAMCEVVCANCHRRRTNRRANTQRWRRSQAR